MTDQDTLRREITALENANMQDRNTLQVPVLADDESSEEEMRQRIRLRIGAREAELKVLYAKLESLPKPSN